MLGHGIIRKKTAKAVLIVWEALFSTSLNQ